MFSTGIKRRRDDSDDELDMLEGKRLRALPLRESPTSRHWALSFANRHVPKPPSLAPTGESSSSDDSSPEPTFTSPTYPSQTTIPSFVSTDVDADMDHTMDDVVEDDMGSPMWSPKAPVHSVLGPSPSTLVHSPVYPQLLSVSSPANNAAARIPTPILSKFSTRPRPVALNAPFIGSSNALSPIPAPGVAGPEHLAHDPLRRRRPMPSPISEDTNSPTTMLRDLDMSGTPMTASTPRFLASAVLTPMSPEFTRRASGADSSTEDRNGSTAFRRRRSDAISGGGETVAGKVVFSMGFRADCEKCREKVPGHYSHVLRV